MFSEFGNGCAYYRSNAASTKPVVRLMFLRIAIPSVRLLDMSKYGLQGLLAYTQAGLDLDDMRREE